MKSSPYEMPQGTQCVTKCDIFCPTDGRKIDAGTKVYTTGYDGRFIVAHGDSSRCVQIKSGGCDTGRWDLSACLELLPQETALQIKIRETEEKLTELQAELEAETC